VLDGRINGYGEVLWIRAMISERINAHLVMGEAQVEPNPESLAKRLELRRGENTFGDGHASFEQLLGRYRKEGKLLPVPAGHTAERARSELQGVAIASSDHKVTDVLPVLPSELRGAALEPNRQVGEDLPRKAG